MYFRLAPPGAMPPRWCDFELVSARTGVRAGLGVSVSAFPFFQSVTIQYNTLSLREEGQGGYLLVPSLVELLSSDACARALAAPLTSAPIGPAPT